MIIRWPDTEELAALVPAGDPAAVKDDLDRIRTEMGRRAFRTKHLRDGRKAQREIAALRTALDGLSPYVESRLRAAARDALVALDDPHGYFASGDVRHRHDVVPGGLPRSPPLGAVVLDALRQALDNVAADAMPERGPKGYGAAIRFAAPALVDLYCMHSGAPRPYYDARAQTTRRDAALLFAHRCLFQWCGIRRAPAPADIVWLLS